MINFISICKKIIYRKIGNHVVKSQWKMFKLNCIILKIEERIYKSTNSIRSYSNFTNDIEVYSYNIWGAISNFISGVRNIEKISTNIYQVKRNKLIHR